MASSATSSSCCAALNTDRLLKLVRWVIGIEKVFLLVRLVDQSLGLLGHWRELNSFSLIDVGVFRERVRIVGRVLYAVVDNWILTWQGRRSFSVISYVLINDVGRHHLITERLKLFVVCYKVPLLFGDRILDSCSWEVLNSFHLFLDIMMRLHGMRVAIHLEVLGMWVSDRDRSVSIVQLDCAAKL